MSSEIEDLRADNATLLRECGKLARENFKLRHELRLLRAGKDMLEGINETLKRTTHDMASELGRMYEARKEDE